MPVYSDNSSMLKYSFSIMPPAYPEKRQVYKPKKNNLLEEIHPKFRDFLDVKLF